MTQLPFPVAVARSTDPITSHLAAASHPQAKQRQWHRLVIALLPGPKTSWQLEQVTRIPQYIAATRLAQIRKRGLVESFGARTDEDGSTRQQWRLTETGSVEALRLREAS